MTTRRILAGGLIVAATLLSGSGPAVAHHEGRDRGDCEWNGDCGDDSYHNEYGRGKNGDQGSAGRDQCHSFCNNVIIVPDPTKDPEKK